jgi:hypothetical protein
VTVIRPAPAPDRAALIAAVARKKRDALLAMADTEKREVVKREAESAGDLFDRKMRRRVGKLMDQEPQSKRPGYKKGSMNAARYAEMVRNLARKLCIEEKTQKQAALELGVSTNFVQTMTRKSEEFAVERQKLLSIREAADSYFKRTVEELLEETALEGAARQLEIVRNSENEDIVRRITADSLDRKGFKPTTKIEATATYSIDPESRELLAKLANDSRSVPIDLEKSEFGYALRQPKDLLADTSEADRKRQLLEPKQKIFED